jgi:hypothetical protein
MAPNEPLAESGGVKAITVDLPTCPVCLNVGKLPADSYSGKQACVGPRESRHKRTKMEPRTFKEVR